MSGIPPSQDAGGGQGLSQSIKDLGSSILSITGSSGQNGGQVEESKQIEPPRMSAPSGQVPQGMRPQAGT